MYEKRKGMRVYLWDARGKKIGIGTYTGSKKLEIFGVRAWIPRFRIRHKAYFGYNCYWAPVKEEKKEVKAWQNI